jgi:hypothetical protein
MVLVTKCGCVKGVCSPWNIEAVRTAMQRSPEKINLEGHGRIKNTQMTSRANFAHWFACVSVQNDSGVWTHHSWCTTETGVYCVGTAWWSNNAQHTVFREGTFSPRQHSKQEQCVLTKKMYHTQKITVWTAIYSHDQAANSECYVSMLHNSSVPQRSAAGSSLNTQRIMQDGATPHTANIFFDFLHDTFALRVIYHWYLAHHGYGYPTAWT